MRGLNTHAPFDEQLALLAATERIAAEVIGSDERTALDPAIPSFFDLASQWTADLNQPFDVAHDRSKPIALEQERLELVMTQTQPGRVCRGDGPRRQLPLLATGVTFADSDTVPQIQVADLLAGAAACYLGAVARGQTDDLAKAIEQTRLRDLVLGGTVIWPDTTVEPSALGAGDDGEALDFTMEIAAVEQRRRFTEEAR